MRIRRDISSIPLRTASETWTRIIELVTRAESKDVDQLKLATDVIASVITDEIPAERPFVFEGCGPQLRVYCRYGPDAIQDGGEVDALTWNPTLSDWTLHVPCDAENLGWVRKALARAPRIKVFDAAEADRAEHAEEAGAASGTEIAVDWGVKD